LLRQLDISVPLICPGKKGIDGRPAAELSCNFQMHDRILNTAARQIELPMAICEAGSFGCCATAFFQCGLGF